MNYKDLAKNIVLYCGGKDNIVRAWCCTTRLRFNLKDIDKIKVDEIKKLSKVVGTQIKNGQFQIIIGNDVDEVLSEIKPLVDENLEEYTTSTKSNIVSQLIETISAIFTPILPAIIGAGMLKCLLSVLIMLNLTTETSDIYKILFMASDAAFYFLPFLIAASASKKFATNEFLGLTIAGILLYPTLINGSAEGLAPMSFLGLPVPYLSYSSSVVPIILGVFLFSKIYKILNKYIPNVFRFILTPMISVLITLPFLLVVLAPLGFYVGNGLSQGLIWLFDVAGPVAGFVLGGLNPLIIMTGMHYAIMPAAIQSIATNGFDNFWLPFALISNLATAGSILAVFIRTKSKDGKAFAFSTMISSVFGVTEPGLYGVQLKLKKPLYCGMCASAIAGCIAVLLGARTYSFSAPNILVLPTYIAPDGNISALIAISIALVISFVLSFIFTFLSKCGGINEEGNIEEKEILKVEETLYSPIEGTYIALEDVDDNTFASGIVGKGFAVFPKTGKVYAPVDGEVIMIFKTKHALAIKSNSGLEVLIHIGLETVNLEGKYFDVKVHVGDKVKKGDLIAEIDKSSIEKEGYDLTTPVIITNYQDFPNLNILSSYKNIDNNVGIIVNK